MGRFVDVVRELAFHEVFSMFYIYPKSRRNLIAPPFLIWILGANDDIRDCPFPSLQGLFILGMYSFEPDKSDCAW